MLDTTNGPAEETLTHKELYKTEEIQQEIAHYFAEHYNSSCHTHMCSDMGGFQENEADELLQNAVELFSSKNKAVSQDFIKDTSFSKAIYKEAKQ